jgi:hypothetical protein
MTWEMQILRNTCHTTRIITTTVRHLPLYVVVQESETDRNNFQLVTSQYGRYAAIKIFLIL